MGNSERGFDPWGSGGDCAVQSEIHSRNSLGMIMKKLTWAEFKRQVDKELKEQGRNGSIELKKIDVGRINIRNAPPIKISLVWIEDNRLSIL
ncbi:hypothetical protein LCGC14_2997010 [marine sediment metagenome]|uniref:Uncharacterized protein n=1 Tax=marine sediment metagenome TaxID=412755 RepID=A0A0F8X2M0_9ZZZZ